ncbi:MAG: NADH-quinone oxidoreductase subunit NuoE [Bacteroidales bacterium]|nr:NADH-quinone oxidoreductase subunit NuoE [Bacteroidales bacterium]MDD2263981.1 NADH-quinone oxidoreductase subunit NuoE [Bacteroidales bacterium]MDD2831215.1 NADH-quinone oxidoreductase subunit NuoE [Bacteroidales bacterium]MDD3208672.1 NADH-quinone oxidoreductase subunit NuoE [Bacteroidales bacterium]MDD3697235.1 NADH-quinone oxidoreductase subunit NuoE [Bacteroidales bacterium]
MKFEINDCHKKTIKEICESFGNKRSELINILHRTQEHFGYLPESVQLEIALNLNMPLAKIYGVVSFYSFFTMTPKGKYPISVCLGTACYVRGAEKIVEALEKELKIKVGQVTEDGKFSLDCLRCIGACGLAPVMMIGEKVHGRLEPEMIADILKEYE